MSKREEVIPSCHLWKEGKMLIIAVEGFDAVTHESKDYTWDLGMLDSQFSSWRLPTQGPVYEKLHHDLQAIWYIVPEEEDRREKVRTSGEPDSNAVELINTAVSECTFFNDQHGTPFAFVKNPGKVMQLQSREFKVWLVKKYYDAREKAVGNDGLNAALNVLEAMASESERIELSTRCAMEGERKLLIDTVNKREEAVIIEASGWRIEPLSRPKFRRYTHMLPLGVASEGADLREFPRFWRFKDPDDEILVIGWIGAAFVSEIPHAILTAIGPKGSTKTSFTRATRQFIDPSSILDMTLSEKGREFVQQPL